jgi:hypothetical protein
MSKPGFTSPGPAGLADWLPLLGSICQVLATLGEADKTELSEPDPTTASAIQSGEERG